MVRAWLYIYSYGSFWGSQAIDNFRVPEKLKYALHGLIEYSIYNFYVTYIFDMPRVSSVQQKLDTTLEIALGFFFVMTIISLFIHFCYDEVYSDMQAEKVIYLREAVADEGESHLHFYATLRALPEDLYNFMTKNFLHEL